MTTLEMPISPVDAVEASVCPFCEAPATPGRAYCSICGQPGAPLSEGTVLKGQYLIAGIIASSATGAVYRARHQRRKRDVAIKELLPPVGTGAADRQKLASRFTHEARGLAHLKHPCLPEVLESFVHDGRYYLVMTLLPGRDVQALLVERQRGFPERQVRDWALRLLDLLDYLQSRHPQFVHGEITPAHLLLREDGTPCLVGYGLAPRLGIRPYLALPGQTVATQPSPGKKRSDKAGPQGPTPRDDLFGLGATLHALLTGRDVSGDAADVERPYPPVHDLAPRVSVGLSEVVGQATAPDPRRRFAAPTPFRAALLTLPPVTGQAPAPLPGMVSAARGERSGGFGRILGLALFLVAAAIIASLLLYMRSNGGQTTSGGSAVASGEVNPLVTSPLPIPAHTLPIADAFIHDSREWPSAAGPAFRQGAELWLDNLKGSGPIKVTRTSYSTGRDGFTLRATLRLAQGRSDASYGLVAVDQAGHTWDNLALLVRADGYWALLRYHGGHAPPLVPWKRTDAVRQGHNVPNELVLTLMPGTNGHSGRFSVTINGRQLATGLHGWSAAPAGRVGVVAGPDARIVCDTFSVAPSGSGNPAFEDHFLRGDRSWSAAGSTGQALLVGDGVLRVRATSSQPWLQATSAGFGPGPAVRTFTEEAVLNMHIVGSGSGGVLFAAAPPGAGNAALAAVVDGKGRVAIIARGAHGAHMVAGPVASSRVRTGYGLNTVRVTVHVLSGGKLRAQVSLNGGAVVQYTGTSKGMAPAAGIVAAGTDASVTASAVRVWD